MTSPSIGTLARLWRYPVKSMLGEPLEAADVGSAGVHGDRGYGLVETTTGKVVSAKNVKAYPRLLHCRAQYVTAPRPDAPLPPVRITLGDGRTLDSDAGDVDAQLSRYFGRDVELRRNAPEDFSIDEYHPDLAADELGPRIEAQLGSALWQKLGARSPVPAGAFFDAFPLSLLTAATLDALAELQPQSRFDERRFRMNLIVRTDARGFVENEWVGRTLAIGAALRVHVALPDPRCVITTLEQDELPRDIGVLRALNAHNRIPVGGSGNMPCAGVYAVIAAPGPVRVGDAVRFD